MHRVYNCSLFALSAAFLVGNLHLSAIAQTSPVPGQLQGQPGAQSITPARRQQALEATKKRQTRTVRRQEFKGTPTKLDKLVNLPGIPLPPGKVMFAYGDTITNDQGTCTFESFSVASAPDEVSQFYKDALSSGDWKKDSSGSGIVSAGDKSGARATVIVQRMNFGKKHGSSVSITYSVSNTGHH